MSNKHKDMESLKGGNIYWGAFGALVGVALVLLMYSDDIAKSHMTPQKKATAVALPLVAAIAAYFAPRFFTKMACLCGLVDGTVKQSVTSRSEHQRHRFGSSFSGPGLGLGPSGPSGPSGPKSPSSASPPMSPTSGKDKTKMLVLREPFDD